MTLLMIAIINKVIKIWRIWRNDMNASIKSVSLALVVLFFSACPSSLEKDCGLGYQGEDCGSDAQKRSCVGDQCSGWVTFSECEEQQICLVNEESHEFKSCEKGCESCDCKECTTGACCDNGHFLAKGTECKEWTAYRCSETTCGAIAQHRVMKQFCTGEGSLCDGRIFNSSWLPTENCNPDAQECESDDNGFSRCNNCKENSTCVDGKCTYPYQICLDSCCSEE
jgi:hypothetical protein